MVLKWALSIHNSVVHFIKVISKKAINLDLLTGHDIFPYITHLPNVNIANIRPGIYNNISPVTERSSRLNCPCEYTHHTVSGNARFLLLVSLRNCDERDSEIKQQRQDSAFSISPNVEKFTATTAK